MSLAGELDYNICIMALSDEGLTDDRLAQALSVVPSAQLCYWRTLTRRLGRVSRVTSMAVVWEVRDGQI